MTDRRRAFAGSALMVALVLAAYAPALHGGFAWDDDFYLTGNPLIGAPDGLRRIWFSLDSPSQYFPLVYTVFRFEHGLWGADPFGYHLLSVLLHAANALLLWRALAVLAVPGSWLGAVFFALHPVQVESVAWISELKNVLSTFLLLGAFLCWQRYLTGAPGRRRIAYGLSLALFALALLAKSTALVLPAVCVALAWMGRLKPMRRVVRSLAPHAAAGLGMGLVTVWWERTVVGTQGRLFDTPLAERLLVAGRAWWFYLAKLAWPTNLAFSYPRWAPDPGQWQQHLWYAAALLALVVAVRASRDVAGALFIHLACLAPLLGFIPLATFRYTFFADHYQYLALAGPLSLLAAASQVAPVPSGARPLVRRLLPLCAVLVWGTLTWRHARDFGSEESLWRDTLAKNPTSWMARNNLGLLLLGQGKPAAAAEQFTLALSLKPDHEKAMNNLGLAREALGDRPAAGHWYREAMRLQPGDGAAATNLALLLEKENGVEQAETIYRDTLRRLPGYQPARYNYAILLASQGRTDEAEPLYREILAASPDHVGALVKLAAISVTRRDYPEAERLYRRAVALAPRSADIQYNLGLLAVDRGDVLEARERHEALQQIDAGQATGLLEMIRAIDK
jgi:tetratricopeptide (TPR) repeat protein